MSQKKLSSRMLQALTALSITAAAQGLWAADAMPLAPNSPAVPPLKTKQMLKGAIQLHITQKGLQFFEHNLTDLISNFGINLEEAFFPAFEWTSEKSHRLEDLQLPPEQKELVQMVSNMLTKWLVGFSIKEFRPTVKVGNTGYTAQFNRMALVTNPELMRSLGKTDGAILTLELDIRNLSVASESVRVSDQNNAILGEVGVDNLNVTIASQENPLKVRLPVYVRMNAQNELEFEAVRFESNLESIDINLSYQKLIAPKVVVEINGHRFEMNQQQLESEVEANLPKILQKSREALARFAVNELPQILNQKAKELLSGSLEEISYMTPPGAATKDDKGRKINVPVLAWGMKVSQINLKQALHIGLDGFVEDPYKATASKPLAGSGSRGAPNFAPFANQAYDIGLSIDRSFINRMLQLSYERGVFRNMPMDDNLNMSLTQVPQLDYIPANQVQFNSNTGADKTYFRLKTRVRVPKGMLTKFKEKMALKEPFEVSLDLIVKMMKNQKGEVWLYYHDIDPASVAIDSKYLSGVGKLFDGTVIKGIREKLSEMAAEWRSQNKLLGEEPFPIPTELMGIRFNISKLAFDPNGHLLVLLNYAMPTAQSAGTVRGQ